MDVQPINLQQLCDTILSIWYKLSVSSTLLNLRHNKISIVESNVCKCGSNPVLVPDKVACECP